MATPIVGDTIAGYRLDAVLGQGGMGCVYRATHNRLGRQVAVKVLADALAQQDEFVSRFLTEARIVNDVRHPNIVDISDFIEQDTPRRVAYVMELVEGPSLSSVLKQQPLDPLSALEVTLQLASALDAVHAVGVVHRDLKPDNVLLASVGDQPIRVKVLDFGIAKSNEPAAQHRTVTGSIMGTPAYMAPEQVASAPVSAATDIYALGEILYEALAGKRLFRGEQMMVLRAKLLGEVPPLELPAEVPDVPRVEALIRSMLALQAEQRPPMTQVVSELRALKARWTGAGVKSAPPPPPRAPAEVEVTPAHLASIAQPADALGLGRRTLPWTWLIGGTLAAAAVAVVAARWTGAWVGEAPIESSALVTSEGGAAPPSAEAAKAAVAPPPSAEASPPPSAEASPPPSAEASPPPPPDAPARADPPARKVVAPKSPARARAKASEPADAEASGPLKRKQLPTW